MIVGPVIFIGLKEKENLAAWDRIGLFVGKNQNVEIEVWEYDSFLKIGRIEVDIKNSKD